MNDLERETPFNSLQTPHVPPNPRGKDVARKLIFRSTPSTPEGEIMEGILEDILELDEVGPPAPAGAVLVGGSFGDLSPVGDTAKQAVVVHQIQKKIGDEEIEFLLEDPNAFSSISKLQEYKIEFVNERITELNKKVLCLEEENTQLKIAIAKEADSSLAKTEAIKNSDAVLGAEKDFISSLRNKTNSQEIKIRTMEKTLEENEVSIRFLEGNVICLRDEIKQAQHTKEEQRVVLQHQINLLNNEINRLTNSISDERTCTLNFVLQKMGYAAADILALLAHIRELNNKVQALSGNSSQFAPDPRLPTSHH
ncbi:uncharacterized protein LOC118435906 [Folsomia candida]|uniref:uncharacterized protein LOC118435906 n=1 Tax=Folsomia candida TaxID=158441 RepID=UPI0016054347|nr:uncharacterized protein LOC118435906 [Folsomia candida]